MKKSDDIDFDWDAAIAKLYKTYEGLPEDIIRELNYYKRRVLILQYNLKEARQNLEFAKRNGYMEGWNDATRKIDNFINRHCKDWFTEGK